jgi:hypothetical protein
MAQLEDRRRRVSYDRLKAERDRLAAELADVYPPFARWVADFLPRLAAATARSSTSTLTRCRATPPRCARRSWSRAG